MLEKLYYIEPLSRDHFHLYNPQTNLCRKGVLRGTLKKGPKRIVSLKSGECLTARKMIGTKKWLIMDRSRQVYPQIVAQHGELEQCDYAD